MSEHFGGSDALGRWSVRDAHAALELAQVQYLQAFDQIQLSSPIHEAEQFFCCLDDRIPTQTNRNDEQIEWQQFATPPRLAWLAARACGLIPDELVLEPSAGTGMLAVWATKAGTRLALNEISPLRRDCLTAAFPAVRLIARWKFGTRPSFSCSPGLACVPVIFGICTSTISTGARAT